VGVDRQRTKPLPYSNVTLILGDLTESDVQKAVHPALGGHADVVTSDLSPNLTGIRFQDHLRSCELVRDAFVVAGGVLRPGGTFLAKIFQGAELESTIGDLKSQFGQVRRVVPAASRKASSEIYILARGFRTSSS
jgi:23S rRNA (uridine2552-2'-O)-methyltransferase